MLRRQASIVYHDDGTRGLDLQLAMSMQTGMVHSRIKILLM